TPDWATSWTREFRSSLAQYSQGMHGADRDLQHLAAEFIEKVIPPVLRPLRTGGQDIRPRLCQENLWAGNIRWIKRLERCVV
ncbi:hypothetical protein C8A01DRAFT_15220, partial [Parachaetomium inaequale]